MTKLFEFLMKCVITMLFSCVVQVVYLISAFILWDKAFISEISRMGDLIWKHKNK